MKKILFIILAVMMLTVGIVGIANADYIRGSTGDKLESYTVYGVSVSGIQATGYVSLTNIPSGTRILGISVTGNGAAAFVALYDSSTMGSATAADVIAEAGAAANTTQSLFFPMPYKVEKQVFVAVGATTDSVTIYYE